MWRSRDNLFLKPHKNIQLSYYHCISTNLHFLNKNILPRIWSAVKLKAHFHAILFMLEYNKCKCHIHWFMDILFCSVKTAIYCVVWRSIYGGYPAMERSMNEEVQCRWKYMFWNVFHCVYTQLKVELFLNESNCTLSMKLEVIECIFREYCTICMCI